MAENEASKPCFFFHFHHKITCSIVCLPCATLVINILFLHSFICYLDMVVTHCVSVPVPVTALCCPQEVEGGVSALMMRPAASYFLVLNKENRGRDTDVIFAVSLFQTADSLHMGAKLQPDVR